MSLTPNLEKFLNEGMSKTFGYEKEKENYRKTMIPFKSPDVDSLSGVEIRSGANGAFEPRASQNAYTEAVVYGDTNYLEGEIKKLKELLPYAEQAYKRLENPQDDFDKRRKIRVQLVVDELKNVISFLETELPKLKQRSPKQEKNMRVQDLMSLASRGDAYQKQFATQYGSEDARLNKPMDEAIVNLAGTPNDFIAKAYTEGYVETKERLSKGGKKKSRKGKAKKVRKTRRVKKLNGRN